MYIRLPVQCPIWTVLPLNLTYTLIFLSQLSWTNLPYADFILDFISIFLSLGRLSKESVQVRGPLWHFVTSLFFTARTPRPSPKLEDYPLSAVCDCLFNIFETTLHIWKASPPAVIWGCAMAWWQGNNLTWKEHMKRTKRQFKGFYFWSTCIRHYCKVWTYGTIPKFTVSCKTCLHKEGLPIARQPEMASIYIWLKWKWWKV
jgi:hypothetical protein